MRRPEKIESTKLRILSYLLEHESNGALQNDLRKGIELIRGVHFPSILEQMLEEALIRRQETPTHGKEKPYFITENGKKFLNEKKNAAIFSEPGTALTVNGPINYFQEISHPIQTYAGPLAGKFFYQANGDRYGNNTSDTRNDFIAIVHKYTQLKTLEMTGMFDMSGPSEKTLAEYAQLELENFLKQVDINTETTFPGVEKEMIPEKDVMASDLAKKICSSIDDHLARKMPVRGNQL
ncbi:MAG: hypothetical protein H6908_03795 [Hyphomicrobiales bacterium]|nr:hypothetical protein [Hyphomicrobiales bacterium]